MGGILQLLVTCFKPRDLHPVAA